MQCTPCGLPQFLCSFLFPWHPAVYCSRLPPSLEVFCFNLFSFATLSSQSLILLRSTNKPAMTLAAKRLRSLPSVTFKVTYCSLIWDVSESCYGFYAWSCLTHCSIASILCIIDWRDWSAGLRRSYSSILFTSLQSVCRRRDKSRKGWNSITLWILVMAGIRTIRIRQRGYLVKHLERRQLLLYSTCMLTYLWTFSVQNTAVSLSLFAYSLTGQDQPSRLQLHTTVGGIASSTYYDIFELYTPAFNIQHHEINCSWDGLLCVAIMLL